MTVVHVALLGLVLLTLVLFVGGLLVDLHVMRERGMAELLELERLGIQDCRAEVRELFAKWKTKKGLP